MVRKSFANLGCSVANTVEILSDSWTVLVLRDLFLGVRRFDEFVTSLGIARNTLSDRLNRLVESGLVSAEPYQERPVRYEYRLTEMGKDLFDVMMTLRAFGEKWTPAADPERQRAIHLGCGQEADAVTHCGHCGERLTRRNVQIVPGLPVVAARAD